MSDSKLCVITKEELRKYKELYVVGDLHGDMDTFQRIMNILKPKNLPFIPPEKLVIFLGDYVDKGPYGYEIIHFMNHLVDYPNVVALMGNHDDRPGDLIEQVKGKGINWEEYLEKTFDPFRNRLYMGALIKDESLLVHGFAYRGMTLDDFMRPKKEDRGKVREKILWSDPTDDTYEEVPNDERGLGIKAGENITREICELFRVRRIIRSHGSDGFRFYHGTRVLSINSSGWDSTDPCILYISPKNPSYFKPIPLYP